MNGEAVHPGDFLYVTGANLDFDMENEAEGVFLVDSAGEATRASIYGRSTARRASLTVPPVADGEYAIELRGRRPVGIGERPAPIRSPGPGQTTF